MVRSEMRENTKITVVVKISTGEISKWSRGYRMSTIWGSRIVSMWSIWMKKSICAMAKAYRRTFTRLRSRTNFTRITPWFPPWTSSKSRMTLITMRVRSTRRLSWTHLCSRHSNTIHLETGMIQTSFPAKLTSNLTILILRTIPLMKMSRTVVKLSRTTRILRTKKTNSKTRISYFSGIRKACKSNHRHQYQSDLMQSRSSRKRSSSLDRLVIGWPLAKSHRANSDKERNDRNWIHPIE